MSVISSTSGFVSKLPHVTLSIFSQMSALAERHKAINLSQGFPNYGASEELMALVTHYMEKGHNQYAPMAGVSGLREVLAQKIERLYGTAIDPESEITITAGGTQALFTAIATVVQAGDEVIVFEPAYDSYKHTVELFGGKVVPIRLLAPDFRIDWTAVKSAITRRTKLIILNNPTNPTAKVLTQEDLLALQDLLRGTSIFVLSDEVYEHIVFDERGHQSIFRFSDLRTRSFVVASFGKLLHTTGWKLGYVVAPPLLSQEFRKIHQFNVFSVNTPMQYAIADYLSDERQYLQLALFFQKKRDYLVHGLTSSRFQILPSEGTYFLLLDYTGISELSELDFAIHLTREHGLATIPVSAFYSESCEQKLLRLCFAKEEQTLARAIEILKGV